jgi:hypothetical protein
MYLCLQVYALRMCRYLADVLPCQAFAAIEQWMLVEDWYLPVHMQNGDTTSYFVDSLSAFWPGLLVHRKPRLFISSFSGNNFLCLER